ncbi:MAG: F0F1 ATP synthase subunit delta [Alphaproteobacteria bacterium]|nr:F0F1 ATP synthase subunit delta [Alphaproteobacteria bacterium]
MKASSTVASRYAVALIELAEQAKAVKAVEKDLNELSSMIESSADLSVMIRSPLAGSAQQAKALLALANKAKFSDLTKNFLGVLAQNGRVNALEAIIKAFSAELSKRRGEISVTVQVAQDMSAAQKKSLEAAIAKTVGSDVLLDVRVEPSILGGMIVTVGSQMIDDSVARKLERLQAAMSKQSNENLMNLKEAK